MTGLENLSPEQRAVVETWGQGMAVLAGAGSGKTTTLVIKCAELMRRSPEARFAAVSFTERSASDLKTKLAERLSLEGEGGALSGHWVMTIHGLCGAIIREYPREAGFDGEESMLSEAESQLLWEQALETLWLDDIPEEVQKALEALLDRESRSSVGDLLKRVRGLHSFGVLEELGKHEDDPSSRSLVTVGQFVLDRYERLKRRRGGVDFDDLERGADRALEIPRVREAYQKRFDLVLVDEFQDTNPVQARIIWRLVRADGSNLCVVGDPKQSIYRFRDADVSVFEDFCSRLPSRHSLTWNFRSRPPIIEFANRVCSQAFAGAGMVYEGLVPKREATAEDAVVRLEIQTPSDLGRWIRQEQQKGIPLDEMALLLRRIRGSEKWFKALTAAGIPIALGSGGLFWEDPRVRELVAFLKWWDNPSNALSGGIFLRAPWVGIPDQDLDQWIKTDETWREPFFRSGHGLAKALAAFREKDVRPGELLMALLVSEDVERELGAPLLGLWHRVEDLSSRGLDFHSVVSEIALASQESRRERDVPPPHNLGQLQVLTFHGAKGLEFPHVFLVDFGEKSRSGDSPLLFWDRVHGAYLAGRDSDGDRDKKDPVEAEWRELERKKNLAESMRVFYVALTRARERLVLVCPPIEKSIEPETAFHSDHWRAWIECAGAAVPVVLPPVVDLFSKRELPAATPGVRTPRSSVTISARRMIRPRHSVTEWNLLSRCPRAYEWTYVRPGSGSDRVGESRKSEFGGTDEMSQRELGTRVHSCLETGDENGLRELENEVGANRFDSSSVIEWARNSIRMRPADLKARREIWSELAFEVPVAGEILVGSIDRLVCDRERYSLVDFKVTRKAKGEASLVEAYGMQMQLYAAALRRLEPKIACHNLSVTLVNITPGGVEEVTVPLGDLNESAIEALARDSAKIVSGAPGEPKPGGLCGVCEFRSRCPDARASG